MNHGFACGAFLALALVPALAHVPYIEEQDLSSEKPFEVIDLGQSKAIYAWIESADDVDVYQFTVTEPENFYAGVIVPLCEEYKSFRPSFALLGPGLPPVDDRLPLAFRSAAGALVIEDKNEPDAERLFSYEFFSNQYYFDGPEHELELTEPGVYQLIFWNPGTSSGDYVAIIGRAERFGAADMVRAAQLTPKIRAKAYLHGDCTAPSF